MSVPAHVKRSSGVAANFLCDNSSYILGADEKGKPERAVQCFEACAALHHKLLDGVDSPAARAVLAFFDTWQPELSAAHPLLAERWKDITDNANLVFCYDYADGRRTVTKDPAIQDAWQRHYHNTDPNAVMALPCYRADRPHRRNTPRHKGSARRTEFRSRARIV